MTNRLQDVGDSITIQVKPKQRGTTTLTGFTDYWRSEINGTIIDGLATRMEISREYRIIEDEMFYSDWQPLTESSIIGKKLKQNNTMDIRFTRKGANRTGVLIFKSIEFNGDFESENIISPMLNNSMFANIAYDKHTEALAKNIFKKLYYRGIIPNYVTRGDNVDISEDRDYVDLFYSISKFFAIVLRFFKRFENFYDDEELMREWIRQNGIYFDESSVTINQLKFIANHLYDEIRKRGTKQIFQRQGDVVNGATANIDGEFIRLIRSKPHSELLYENIPLYKMGWCLGKSSPLYRGTMSAENLNKTKERGEDFEDLANYKTFALKNSNLTLEMDGNRRVLTCKTSGKSSCGLGRNSEDEDVAQNLYVADPHMDYEITFMFKSVVAGNGATINFGVEGFDGMKKKLRDAFITMDNYSVGGWMMKEIPLRDNFATDRWYFVRGIIHAYSTETTNTEKLNIGYGNNLAFNNRFVKYILPKIYLSSTNSSTIEIWNYKIRPLVRGTNVLPLRNGTTNSYSLGFIQAPRIFYSVFRNNNNNQSRQEITDIIERYLLPFNMTNILQFIDNENQ